MRPFLAVALLIAAAPALRADDKPEVKADKKAQQPAIVLRLKSLEGILADAKYLTKLADAEEQFKQAEEFLKTFSGDAGLGGIDMKRPFALYGDISPGLQDSPVVLLVPIADPKAFVSFLEGVNIKPEKGKDDVYTIDNIPGAPIPVTVYFRFANKYAYITAMEKGNIAEKKLLKPEAVLPVAGDTSLASLTLRLEGFPDILKQIVLTQIESKLSEAKEQNPPNETPALKKLRHAMIDTVSEKIKSLLTDGEEATIKLGVDQKKEDISADFSFKAKKGSQLAKDMASVGKASNLFSALTGDNTALRVVSAIALPAEVRKVLGPAIDDAIKDAIAKETDPNKAKLMKATFDAFAPTLKAGELDAGVAVVGPDKDGHMTIIGGAKVVKGKGIEDVVREIYKEVPENERKNIVLDATKVGDVNVHKIVIPETDENAKKLLGESSAYVAIRDDMVLVAAGPDALKAIKDMLAAPAKSSSALLKVDLAVARAAQLDTKDPNAAKVARDVFGKDPKGSDAVSVTVEMGESLKVSFNAKAKIITLGAKAQKDK
jgi:hypothetical protein